LVNVNSSHFQLYHRENKLIFNEMMMCLIEVVAEAGLTVHVCIFNSAFVLF